MRWTSIGVACLAGAAIWYLHHRDRHRREPYALHRLRLEPAPRPQRSQLPRQDSRPLENRSRLEVRIDSLRKALILYPDLVGQNRLFRIAAYIEQEETGKPVHWRTYYNLKSDLPEWPSGDMNRWRECVGLTQTSV